MGVAGDACMAGVATLLRSAREHAGLTIEEIAARTKISPAALAAIERGDFDRLPGEFFARAFVRSYAQELRLPVPEVMAEYRCGGAPAPSGPAARRHGITAKCGVGVRRAPDGAAHYPAEPDHRRVVGRSSSDHRGGRDAGRESPRASGGSRTARGRNVRNRASDRSARSRLVRSRPVCGDPPTTRASPRVLSKLTLEIRPSRRLWVTGHADGRRVLYRNIQPGERVVVEGSELSFRVGDAGAFEYTLNGVPGKPPGRSGEVREFRITRENYREFAR